MRVSVCAHVVSISIRMFTTDVLYLFATVCTDWILVSSSPAGIKTPDEVSKLILPRDDSNLRQRGLSPFLSFFLSNPGTNNIRPKTSIVVLISHYSTQ